MVNKARQLYEFGPFRIDPDHRQLLRENQPVPLQPKAFDILLVLVQNSEKVVLKDDLMEKVWADTFVEESNLSQHIFVLRKTLGDVVEEKRYIVTVPGRGYRFAQTVRAVAVEEEERKKEAGTTDDREEQIVVASRSLATVTLEKHRKGNLRPWIAVGAMVMAIAVAIGLYWRSQRKPKLTEKDTIVVGDFDNETGDPVFDGTLRQGLSAQLEQSPFLNLLSDERTAQSLTLMTQPKDSRLSPELAREVCQRTASAAVLNGAIAQIGERYLLTLRAVNCSTGETLASAESEATDKNQVLDALGKLATGIRTQLGESLLSVQKFPVPIEATTSSLEALENLSTGVRVYRENGDAPSIPFFERAIELDPNFAMAYAWLSTAYGDLLQPSLGLEYASKAYQLRDRVTEREKLRITLSYFAAMGELDKEAETCERWTVEYPNDDIAHGFLGKIYHDIGQYDKALAEFQDLMRLAPDIVLSYSNVGVGYIFLNRLDEAKATFAEAREHKLDSGNLHQQIYILAFLQGDEAEMEQQVAWGAAKPGAEDILLSEQSDTEAYYGRMSKARDLSQRAVDSAVRAGSKETAALWQVNAGLREAEVGNTSAARQEVALALALSQGRDVKVIAAITLARMGDALRAKLLAEELKKTYPTNTLMKFYWLPTIEAAIEVGKNNSSRAVVELEPVGPYELGLAGGYINYLYPAYVRGQAYLLTHNGSAAVAEFQKLLDHSGIVENFVTGALAHLEIGRAYATAGDAAKAKAAYQDFLTLWKDADPDIPILKQAKAEYAKLR